MSQRWLIFYSVTAGATVKFGSIVHETDEGFPSKYDVEIEIDRLSLYGNTPSRVSITNIIPLTIDQAQIWQR